MSSASSSRRASDASGRRELVVAALVREREIGRHGGGSTEGIERSRRPRGRPDDDVPRAAASRREETEVMSVACVAEDKEHARRAARGLAGLVEGCVLGPGCRPRPSRRRAP